MVAFGGSGPAHAARIAAKLNVPRIVLPPGAGVMSALGLLRSPFAFETARSQRTPLAGLDAAIYAETFAEMERQVRAVLDEAGIDAGSVTIRRRLDMRYAGQGYEVEVAADATPEGLAERFYAAYRAVFSAIVLDEPLEIVNWKLEASGPEPMRDRPFRLDHASSSAGARIGERQAYVPGAGLVATPVYDRYRLDVGAVVTGPAIIEERESTTVLGHHDSAHIDPHRNLVIDIGKGDTGP